MIRNLTVTRYVLEARGGVRERAGKEIVRQHPLQGSGKAAAAPRPGHGERHGRVPAPAGLEHRCVEQRLDQDVARRVRVKIPEHIRQRKRVLGSE
jgi:hypothetical protein